MPRLRGLMDVKAGAGAARLKLLFEWIAWIGLAAALAVSVRVWVGQLVTVDGPSMQPALWTGEKVLIGKVEYYFAKPKRGDIVLARFPESDRNYIKRVIALGGERIRISGGYVYIDDKKLSEPYASEPTGYDMDELAVPEDCVFLLGDNRNDSTDSHNDFVGAIPLSRVEGRAYALLWPLGKIMKLTGYSGKLEQ
jgi:signal peptidase I